MEEQKTLDFSIEESTISFSENDDQEIVESNQEIVSDDPVTKEDLKGL